MVRRKKQTGSMWADDSIVEERLNPEVAPFMAGEKKAKRIRRYVNFAVYGAPFLLILAVFGVFTWVTANVDANTAGVAVVDKDATARHNAARIKLDTWMAGEPAPLPGGRVLGFDREEEAIAVGEVKEGTETQAMFTEVFTVTDASGNLYEASVVVSVLKTGVIGAGDSVTLTPYVYQTGTQNEGWLGMKAPSEVDDKVVEVAVSAWAEALYSGDASLLKNAVGDTNKAHAYIPMPLAKVRTEISDTSTVSSGEKLVVARVNVVVNWLDAENNSYVGDGEGDGIVATYDVLLEGAYEGSARVVAWGPVGQAASLTPYSNAVESGVDVVGISYMSGWGPKVEDKK